jgi:hypothetical protein
VPLSYGCRLSQAEAGRLGRLLRMEYTPTELAEELQISPRRLWRDFVPAGCPHRRDESDRLWIIGSAFREWYTAFQDDRRRPMARSEAWCLRCKEPVKMVGPFEVRVQAYTEIVQARCAQCGGVVNRARQRQQPEVQNETPRQGPD